MPELIFNVLLQALTFGIAGVGVAIVFRVVRYPDLTADGSFMLGGAVFAASLANGLQWSVAMLLSLLAGGAAGALTAALNSKFGVGRLLSGILTTMICYSIAFHLLNGRPSAGLSANETMFASNPAIDAESLVLIVAAVFAGLVILAVWHLLRSELGLLLRATGANARLVADLGRSTAGLTAVGLAVGNGLVAMSAALVSGQQGFVDINLGTGIVVTLIASLVLGEEIVQSLPRGLRTLFLTRTIAPFLGAAIYFLAYLLIVRASLMGWLPISIEPTDLKLLSAALVILVVALRRQRDGSEDLLPL
jgi:putative ABC transport system permease protein